MTEPSSASPCNKSVLLDDLIVMAGCESMLRANGMDSLGALFDVSSAERLDKPGLGQWRERLRLSLDVDGQPRIFYIKRFRNPPARARREIRRSGGGASSFAGLEWAWMHRLAADGIPCVRPIAFGEMLHGSREVRSAILTAAVPGDSLERWAQRWRDGDRSRIRSLFSPLAALISRLHRRGYIHRDLYLSHIFHDPALPPEASLHLIDLQRVIHPQHLRRRWIVKDLAALNFSTPSDLVSGTDRLRWLTQYLGVSKLDPAARRLVYRILGKTRRIANHERHRAARWQRRSDES